MSKKTAILYSPLFLAGLILLILNDHVLKATYPGLVTGKLSDFAGLLIFPMFFAAFFPNRKRVLYFTAAIGFIFWKSPLSQFFIDRWNQHFISINRIVDYTDLLALLILPLSYFYFVRYKKSSTIFNPTPIILISSLAFIATSRSPHRTVEIKKEFSMQFSIDTLKSRMFFHPHITNNSQSRKEWFYLDSIEKSKRTFLPKYTIRRKKTLIDEYCKNKLYFEVNDTSDECLNHYASVKLVQNRKISKVILLHSSYYHCRRGSSTNDDKELLTQQFENVIIKPISY